MNTHRLALFRFWIPLLLMLAVVLFLLWDEHKAHIIGVLPWLVIAACPLMHLFMHRKHRHSGGRNDRNPER
ncbi:DUF2933 domain-containing protein [Marinobacter halodurans]|uniref:DUF2933 domain-containing protein n=1 Tax=Marinobacter halodurans TaxID=2528979 RepID=A0ABY1ZU58_9GAMM|nr:DUF2933 domain-containing protein [Marinobacter halodurans]TBW59619.1 DUF2933 domain-containing protein [Marinobacter halodurans]